MSIEVRQNQGLFTGIKRFATIHFPTLYTRARLLKEDVGYFGTFPYTVRKFVGGINFDIQVGCRQEQIEVDGPYFESDILTTLLDRTRPGDVIYDIGAATGSYTLPSALKTGDSGIVYSFEPDSDRANILRDNISLNGLTNVEVLETALWSHDTLLGIHSSGRKGLAPQVREIGKVSYSVFVGNAEIQARSINSLVREGKIRLPDIVKIDVEGVNRKVLEGMNRVSPRDFFIEVHPRMGESVDEINSLMIGRGYRLVSQQSRQQEIHTHFTR